MIKHVPGSEPISGQQFQFVDGCMVSQLTKLLCCLTSDLFARTLLAASFSLPLSTVPAGICVTGVLGRYFIRVKLRPY